MMTLLRAAITTCLKLTRLQTTCEPPSLQAIIGLVSGDWWVGAAAGSFYFIGREYAQAEYRNIEHNYDGRRVNMPYFGGLELRAWTLKGVLDFVLPSLAVILVALLRSRIF
jgi:hypothetical protein